MEKLEFVIGFEFGIPIVHTIWIPKRQNKTHQKSSN